MDALPSEPLATSNESVSLYEEDWEDYNPNTGLSFRHHMFAGSMAGVMEHVAMFPFDTLKVRSFFWVSHKRL